jgi:hypothetical protein
LLKISIPVFFTNLEKNDGATARPMGAVDVCEETFGFFSEKIAKRIKK